MSYHTIQMMPSNVRVARMPSQVCQPVCTGRYTPRAIAGHRLASFQRRCPSLCATRGCAIFSESFAPFKSNRHRGTSRSRYLATKSTGTDNSTETSTQEGNPDARNHRPDAPKEEQGNSGKTPPGSGWWSRAFASIPKEAFKLVLQLLAFAYLLRMWPAPHNKSDGITVRVPFSTFVHHMNHRQLREVQIDGSDLTYQLRPAVQDRMTRELSVPKEALERIRRQQLSLRTERPRDYALDYNMLSRQGVKFATVQQKGPSWYHIALYACYMGALLALLNKLPVKLPAKAVAGRRHKIAAMSRRVTFADVAGVDEAKEELWEVVDYLRHPDKFVRLGARPPAGILLTGPPGTGKTLLAKAVAGEAGVPFFSIAASEFVELYVGVGALRVRELFANARKEAPAIVFIDEIDAVAKGRSSKLHGSMGNDEREQTLNQLLTELDGFDTSPEHTLICIAATNRPDVLDSALLRPGRFDRRVAVERPDRVGREQILSLHLSSQSMPLANDVSVPEIAAMTTGFTGADLRNLVNEAALLAGREALAAVARSHFQVAVLRAVAGIEKKRSVLHGAEKAAVAVHEAGHALVSAACRALLPATTGEVTKLSIIPRSGGALGFTYIPPQSEDRALLFERDIRGQLAMLMAGRAAEQLCCGQVSTGASDDIQRATSLAYAAVAQYGLSPAIGPLNVEVVAAGGGADGGLVMKDAGVLGAAVENEVKALCEAALDVAADTLRVNAELHARLASDLRLKERLEGPELLDTLSQTAVADSLAAFVLHGTLPPHHSALMPAALSPTLPAAAAAAIGGRSGEPLTST